VSLFFEWGEFECGDRLLALRHANTGGSASPGQQGDVELTLVSYAVTRAAYEKIIPEFTAKWKQDHNKTLPSTKAMAALVPKARAVVDGL